MPVHQCLAPSLPTPPFPTSLFVLGFVAAAVGQVSYVWGHLFRGSLIHEPQNPPVHQRPFQWTHFTRPHWEAPFTAGGARRFGGAGVDEKLAGESSSDSSSISFLSEAATPSTSSSPASESVEELLHSLALGYNGKWMTDDDRESKLLLAQFISQMPPPGGPLVAADSPGRLLDYAIPDNVVVTIDPIPGEGFGDGNSQSYLKKKTLGVGSFNAVASAIPVPTPVIPSPLLRPRPGLAPARSRKMAQTVAAAVQRHMLDRSLASASKEPEESPESGEVALRFPMVRRIYDELDVESAILSAVQDSRILLSKFPSGITISDLLHIYGIVLPQTIGQVRGKASRLARVGHYVLMNLVQVLPRMETDLFVAMSYTASSRFFEYSFKRVIQLGAYLGAMGLVHHDLKRENILVDKAGQLYLADFDSAMRAGEMIECRKVPTPDLAPPEVVKCMWDAPSGNVASHPSMDAWKIGMLAWDMVCFSAPFPGMGTSSRNVKRALEVLYALSTSEESNTRALDWERCRGEPSAEIKELIEALLDRNPATRSTALDLFLTATIFEDARATAHSTPV